MKGGSGYLQCCLQKYYFIMIQNLKRTLLGSVPAMSSLIHLWLVCFGHTSCFKNAQKKGCECVRQEDRLSCFGCIFYALKLQYDGTVHCLEGRPSKVVANVAWRAVECEH